MIYDFIWNPYTPRTGQIKTPMDDVDLNTYVQVSALPRVPMEIEVGDLEDDICILLAQYHQ